MLIYPRHNQTVKFIEHTKSAIGKTVKNAKNRDESSEAINREKEAANDKTLCKRKKK